MGSRRPRIPEIGVVAVGVHRWNGPWMTPHQRMTGLAEFFHVVWLEPSIHWRDALRGSRADEARVEKTPPAFRVQRPEPWLPRFYGVRWLDHLALSARMRRAATTLRRAGCTRIVLYLWHPQLDHSVEAGSWDATLYHLDDDYALMGRKDTPRADLETLERERRLFEKVDRIVAISPRLVEKVRAEGREAELIPHGVDFDAFARPRPEPPDLAQIPRPRVGYVGVIKRQLDWDLVARFALGLKNHSFVFVGPLLHPELRATLARLESLPNVHILGNRPVEELPAYVQALDVCILPYVLNDYTHSIYPLKLHEVLAAGRAIVATPIRSLLDFPEVVAFARDAREWEERIPEVLAADSPESVTRRQDVARRHDWSVIMPQTARIICEAAMPGEVFDLG